MEYSRVQRSTVEYSGVQLSTVEYSEVQTVNSWSVPAITLNLAFIDELLWPLLKKKDVLSPFQADIVISKCNMHKYSF